MEIDGNTQLVNDINHLQKWFEDNKNLPNKIDRIYLTRFYYRTGKDIEETKKVLVAHYTARSKYPHIYFNRDPDSQDTLNTAAYVHMLALPGLTPDNNRVVIIALHDPDPKLMHFTEDIRTYIMTNDGRFSIPDVTVDNKPLIAEGVIQIIDMNQLVMKHMTQLSFFTLRIFMKYLQQVCPVLIKGIHVINCKLYINTIFAIVKPFLKKEVIEMIHFHINGLETLYDHIPRDMLPKEYGGKAGTVAALSEDLKQSIRVQRDYLMDPDYWTIQKSET